MIFLLIVFIALVALVQILYIRRRREELRERMALLSWVMQSFVYEVQQANADLEVALGCSSYR